MNKKTSKMILTEQNPAYRPKKVKAKIINDGGQILVQLEGYGEKNAEDKFGCPVIFDIWQERLRLVVADDINSEDPQIIDLEKANESGRILNINM